MAEGDEAIIITKKRKSCGEVSEPTGGILAENNPDPEIVEIKRVAPSEQNMNSLRTLSLHSVKNIIKRKRKWRFTKFGKHYLFHPVPGLEFTVMSYNVLSQTLLENHSYLYKYCKPEHLSWEYRSQNLFQEIDNYDADIMCFQEVQEDHYKDAFFPHLFGKGYLGFYKKKTGNTCDGCAIFFRKNMFMLEDKKDVEYFKPGIKVLDRNNIGLIAVFKPKHPMFQHLKLVCATTHLLFNSRRGDVKLAQLRTLLATIEETARKNIHNENRKEYHPIILCGDMNSYPFYPLYNFIVRGHIDFNNSYSGDISGQTEGYSQGRIMSEDALNLTALGIDRNTCFGPVNDSKKPESPGSQSLENLNLQNKESTPRDTESANKEKDNQHGHFFHHLNFASAYKHTSRSRGNEVSTRHSHVMGTVDYIFYNVIRDGVAWENDCRERYGQLKHISSCSLLHEADLDGIELPNAYLASDHFSLLSKFLLT